MKIEQVDGAFLLVQARTENGISSTQITDVPNKSGSNVMVGTLCRSGCERGWRGRGGGPGQTLRREDNRHARGQEQGPAKSV